MRSWVAAIVLGGVMVPQLSSYAVAQRGCRGGALVVDERNTSKRICLARAEVKRAKAICAGIAKTRGRAMAWTNCVCQDGNRVGACGD
jgi:hypothetical protein